MYSLVKNSIRAKDMSIKSSDIPKRNADEVLIRVNYVGICGSDLHMYYGDESYEWINFPLVLGHEIVGEVIESNKSGLIGEKVLINPYIPCGECDYCKNNEGNLCDNNNFFVKKNAPESLQYGFRRNGGMSEYLVVREENCIVIEKYSDIKVTAILESIAVGYQAIKKINYKDLNNDAPILIYGPGPIGLGILATLIGLGFKNVTVVGTEKDKHRLLKAQNIGAKNSLVVGTDLEKTLLSINESGYKFIFETSGHPISIDSGSQVASKGAKIILVGISASKISVAMDQLVRGELSIQGSYGINSDSLHKVIEFSNQPDFNFQKLIDKSFEFSDYEEAFEEMRSGKYCKVILDFT